MAKVYRVFFDKILIFFAKKSQFNTGYNEKKTLRFRLGFYWGEIPGKNHDFYEKGVTPPLERAGPGDFVEI